MSKLKAYYQIIDSIADFVNQKVDEGAFPDHCSTAGLEEWDEEEHEWMTWYDEDGDRKSVV